MAKQFEEMKAWSDLVKDYTADWNKGFPSPAHKHFDQYMVLVFIDSGPCEHDECTGSSNVICCISSKGATIMGFEIHLYTNLQMQFASTTSSCTEVQGLE